MIVGINYVIKFIGCFVIFIAAPMVTDASDVDIVTRASKSHITYNEVVDVYIHIKNKSDRSMSLPAAKLVDGFLIPYRYQEYIETYLVKGSELEPVSGVSGSVKNTGHHNKRSLSKYSTVCYKIRCIPFPTEDGTNLSVVSLNFLGFKNIIKQQMTFYKVSKKP